MKARSHIFLTKIRTPLAHNRDGLFYNFELQIAEGYCKEILEVIESWKKKEKKSK